MLSSPTKRYDVPFQDNTEKFVPTAWSQPETQHIGPAIWDKWLTKALANGN